MNNFQRLSLEYDGIYGTLNRYTSDANLMNYLSKLKEGIADADYDTIIYTLSGIDKWYDENIADISSNEFLKCKMRPYSDVLSATEVSKFTGYHHNTITTWCSNGYFRYFKIGSSYMIPKVCILNFLVSPHVLDSYRPAQKMAALAKEFSQQGKPTEKSSA